MTSLSLKVINFNYDSNSYEAALYTFVKSKNPIIFDNGIISDSNRIQRILEKIKGWFGGIDRSKTEEKEYRVIQLLEYGIKNEFLTSHKAKQVAKKVFEISPTRSHQEINDLVNRLSKKRYPSNDDLNFSVHYFQRRYLKKPSHIQSKHIQNFKKETSDSEEELKNGFQDQNQGFAKSKDRDQNNTLKLQGNLSELFDFNLLKKTLNELSIDPERGIKQLFQLENVHQNGMSNLEKWVFDILHLPASYLLDESKSLERLNNLPFEFSSWGKDNAIALLSMLYRIAHTEKLVIIENIIFEYLKSQIGVEQFSDNGPVNLNWNQLTFEKSLCDPDFLNRIEANTFQEAQSQDAKYLKPITVLFMAVLGIYYLQSRIYSNLTQKDSLTQAIVSTTNIEFSRSSVDSRIQVLNPYITKSQTGPQQNTNDLQRIPSLKASSNQKSLDKDGPKQASFLDSMEKGSTYFLSVLGLVVGSVVMGAFSKAFTMKHSASQAPSDKTNQIVEKGGITNNGSTSFLDSKLNNTAPEINEKTKDCYSISVDPQLESEDPQTEIKKETTKDSSSTSEDLEISEINEEIYAKSDFNDLSNIKRRVLENDSGALDSLLEIIKKNQDENCAEKAFMFLFDIACSLKSCHLMKVFNELVLTENKFQMNAFGLIRTLAFNKNMSAYEILKSNSNIFESLNKEANKLLIENLKEEDITSERFLKGYKELCNLVKWGDPKALKALKKLSRADDIPENILNIRLPENVLNIHLPKEVQEKRNIKLHARRMAEKYKNVKYGLELKKT